MFVIQIAPYRQESLDSYFYRIGFASGLGGDDWLNSIQLPREISRFGSSFIYQKELFSNLTQYISLAENDLREMTIYNQLKSLMVPETTGITKIAKRYTHPRNIFCPLCIKDRPYQRLYWLFKLVISCPEHSVYMEDHCPECSSEITLRSLVTGNCSCCGFPLSNVPTRSSTSRHCIKVNQQQIFNGYK